MYERSLEEEEQMLMAERIRENGYKLVCDICYDKYISDDGETIIDDVYEMGWRMVLDSLQCTDCLERVAK